MNHPSPSWKALILAAGFGTRLLPYTRHTPKPLFTINNRPVLDRLIDQLARSGCGGLVVNTHHLHHQIENHCRGRRYPLPVRLSHEPEILGTGGAMRHNAAFLGDGPFLVVNADIVTDIDFAAVYRFHLDKAAEVTLVMHDRPEFNGVAVDRDRVTRFYRAGEPRPAGERLLAFTGIHVIHPRLLGDIPAEGHVDIIDVYQERLNRGRTIKACIVEGHQWQDIGTPAAYRALAFREMAGQAMLAAGKDPTVTAVDPIPSDGSDTRWFRVLSADGSLIACDRGIRQTTGVTEAASFGLIGRHLADKGLAVPHLYLSDDLAGLAFLEDLGDVSLQAAVRALDGGQEVLGLYLRVIESLIGLAIRGAEGFDDAWTCQTPTYDRQVIIEREGRYFKDAFLTGYLGLNTGDVDLETEFSRLADLTLSLAVPGLMHRDMQSRNIMIRDGRPYFIDFQGARRGPVQYDLASLLIDPYVDLPVETQNRLREDYLDQLAARLPVNPDLFRQGFACCALTRNLQILGAFGFLTRAKGKQQFAAYIPAALDALIRNLAAAESLTGVSFPSLRRLADRAQDAIADRE
jgi:aminoglycoside/choline kinase family phosphotransferase/GTP:adenosylcobinamide-phosphate guanylyltransferase